MNFGSPFVFFTLQQTASSTPPAFTLQPINGSGEAWSLTPATFTAGGVATYQWQYRFVTDWHNFTDDDAIQGSATDTLSLYYTNSYIDGVNIRCKSGAVTSDIVTLSCINSIFIPVNHNVYMTEDASINTTSVSVCSPYTVPGNLGPTLTYLWEEVSGHIDITIDDNTLEYPTFSCLFNSAAAEFKGSTWRVTVTTDDGIAVSNPAIVTFRTVLDQLNAPVDTSEVNFVYGLLGSGISQSTNITLSGGTEPFTYEWSLVPLTDVTLLHPPFPLSMPTVTIDTPDQLNTTFSVPVSIEYYTLRYCAILKITDDIGNVGFSNPVFIEFYQTEYGL